MATEAGAAAGEKIRHCAWGCDRYWVDGAWRPLVPAPDRRTVMVTDGICPACEAAYEAGLALLERKEIR